MSARNATVKEFWERRFPHMLKTAEYLTVKQLAERLGMSVTSARYLARSKRLRAIRGAVINVNMAGGKYEILKINVDAAIRVFEAL